MEVNIYRLKNIKPLSYQLPLKETFVKKFVEKNGERKDLGFRRIVYIPGVESIYAEDNTGDLKPQTLWFENGDLRVRKDDKLLNLIMTSHKWFNERYELWSEEEDDKRKLKELKFKSQARRLIDDSDEEKIKAIALAVFGVQAILWTDVRCEIELREQAENKPKLLQSIMKDKDYESKYLSGLAFVMKVVEENIGKTAVIWADSQGMIVNLAKGENGIQELARYLSKNSEESNRVLQGISERIERIDTKTLKINVDTSKDDEIAELKAKLKDKDETELKAKLKGKDDEIAELKKQLKVKSAIDNINPETITSTTSNKITIEEARESYLKKYKKKVANVKNNDLDWIISKL